MVTVTVITYGDQHDSILKVMVTFLVMVKELSMTPLVRHIRYINRKPHGKKGTAGYTALFIYDRPPVWSRSCSLGSLSSWGLGTNQRGGIKVSGRGCSGAGLGRSRGRSRGASFFRLVALRLGCL